MKLIRNALVIGALAVATVVGCSSTHPGSNGPTATNNGNNTPSVTGADGTGSIGAHLVLAPGTNIYSLNWAVNGPNMYSGVVTFGDANSIEFVAGGIVSGSGYTITLSGNDTNGDPCTGTSPTFSVSPGAVTQVVLQVVCTVPTDGATPADVNTGSIEIDAGISLVNQGAVACPGISSFAISPAELRPGQPSQLSLMTVGPTPIIQWSASPAADVTISNPTSANPTLVCNVPMGAFAQVTVTATVSLQDSGLCNGKMFTTMSALVNCESGAAVCPPGQTACGDAGACFSLQTDPSNCGTCGNVCPAGTPSCSGGTCHPVPPTCCTVAPCGATQVTCPGSPGGVCTPTEAKICQYDIDHGTTTGPGAPPAVSCYSCMVKNACIDGDAATNGLGAPVTNVECGDPDTAAPSPPFTTRNVSSTNAANCLDALDCVIKGTDPTADGGTSACSLTPPPPQSVGNCFCGSNRGAACIATTASPIGVCASREYTDMGTMNPTTVVSKFTDPSFSPGSVGNAILNCALGAGSTGACVGRPCFK